MQKSKQNKVSITRRFQFCAGHRVYQHESKCAHPHGHNYVMLATFQTIEEELDALGRVIDFSIVKEVLGGWIDTHWDHGFIYFDRDHDIKAAMSVAKSWKTYAMSSNPTAENMAAHLLHDICPKIFLGLGVSCTQITLWETENCYATSSL